MAEEEKTPKDFFLVFEPLFLSDQQSRKGVPPVDAELCLVDIVIGRIAPPVHHRIYAPRVEKVLVALVPFVIRPWKECVHSI